MFEQGTFFQRDFLEKISAILPMSIPICKMKKINLPVLCKLDRFGYRNLCKCLPNFVNVAALLSGY